MTERSHSGPRRGAPSISCVIPVFNGERYLAEAIESAVSQTHPPLEVIVVDDGSTDASANAADAYGHPVHVLRRSHAGQAAARHAGIVAARGEFVALLDGDDTWHPEKLARQIARFDEVPGLSVSLAMAENFWEDGLVDEEARYRATARLRAAHHFSSILTRRALLVETLPLNVERSSGDQLDWFLRAREAKLEMDVIEDVLVFRRMHASSLSHTTDTVSPYLEVIKASLDRRRARSSVGR